MAEILWESTLLDTNAKQYIINKKYTNIINEANKSVSSVFSKGKQLDNNLRFNYPDYRKDGINWHYKSESVIGEYKDAIMKDKLKKEYEKLLHSTVLEIIHLSDEEINIINVLFHRILFNHFRKIKINDTITIEGIVYLIDNSTNFEFNCIWCRYDPFAYNISRVVFDSETNNKTAYIRYGWEGDHSNGKNIIMHFIKKGNKWKKDMVSTIIDSLIPTSVISEEIANKIKDTL